MDDDAVPIPPNTKCVATDDYVKVYPDELSFCAGDVLVILEPSEVRYWYLAENSHHERGIVPITFMKVINDIALTQTVPKPKLQDPFKPPVPPKSKTEASPYPPVFTSLREVPAGNSHIRVQSSTSHRENETDVDFRPPMPLPFEDQHNLASIVPQSHSSPCLANGTRDGFISSPPKEPPVSSKATSTLPQSSPTPPRASHTQSVALFIGTKPLPTPQKVSSTPTKVLATPSKVPSTPNKVLATSSKAPSTPIKVLVTPSKVPSTPLATPSKACSTPTKFLATPSKASSTPKKVLATPSKASSKPTKVLATPSNVQPRVPATPLVAPLPKQYTTVAEFRERSGWFRPSVERVLMEKLQLTLQAFIGFNRGTFFFQHKWDHTLKYVGWSCDIYSDLIQLIENLYEKSEENLNPLEATIRHRQPDAATWNIRTWRVENTQELHLEAVKLMVKHRTLHPCGLNKEVRLTSTNQWEDFCSWYTQQRKK